VGLSRRSAGHIRLIQQIKFIGKRRVIVFEGSTFFEGIQVMVRFFKGISFEGSAAVLHTAARVAITDQGDGEGNG